MYFLGSLVVAVNVFFFLNLFYSVTSYQLISRVAEGGFLNGNYTVLFETSVFFVCF